MKRIAVVRLDKIGDLILTTPAIASLKKAYPESRLTAIVNPYNRGVLEHSPDVNEIWDWSGSLNDFRRLRKAAFDAVIVFSPTTRSYVVALLSGARIRAGYVYKSRILTRMFSRFCLTTQIVCSVDQKDIEGVGDSPRRDSPRRINGNGVRVPHEVEQNLEVVSALGVQDNEMSPKLVVPVSAKDLEWARKSLGEKSYVGVHLSEAWNNGLPADFFSRLLAELSKFFDLFVTQGPGEGEWARKLRFPENVKRFENLEFSRWAALFHEAKLVISTNTGAIHLAASQGAPVVAVFEPRFYAYHRHRWAPWQVPSVILRKDDSEFLDKIVKGALTVAEERCRGQSA